MLGLCGLVLGVALGPILAWIISSIGIPMPPPPNANLGYTAHIRVVPSIVLMAFGMRVSATFLAALVPARRAARAYQSPSRCCKTTEHHLLARLLKTSSESRNTHGRYC